MISWPLRGTFGSTVKVANFFEGRRLVNWHFPWSTIYILGKQALISYCLRALPDITSSPEVWQIFKIRNVWKLDVFLPGCLTWENRKKIKNVFKNFKKFSFNFLKIFLKDIRPNSVRSDRTCPVRKFIYPVRSSPILSPQGWRKIWKSGWASSDAALRHCPAYNNCTLDFYQERIKYNKPKQ